MLKDEKRKSQFKYELGRLMGEYAVPLPLGNFNQKDRALEELKRNVVRPCRTHGRRSRAE